MSTLLGSTLDTLKSESARVTALRDSIADYEDLRHGVVAAAADARALAERMLELRGEITAELGSVASATATEIAARLESQSQEAAAGRVEILRAVNHRIERLEEELQVSNVYKREKK